MAVAREIARAVASTGRPLVAQTMYRRLAGRRGPARGRHSRLPDDRGGRRGARRAASRARRPTGRAGAARADARGVYDGYFGARDLLEAAGMPFVAARRAIGAAGGGGRRPSSATRSSLKALGTLHKSDAGGVVVGIADARSCGRPSPTCASGWSRPGSRSSAMAPLGDGVELIVGARRDPRFGPVALVGLGGIYTETLRATSRSASRRSTPQEAERMLRSLRGAALLAGARGRPPCDVRPRGGAAAALSSAGRGAPRHRRDRDQPPARHARRRPRARRAHDREGDGDAG